MLPMIVNELTQPQIDQINKVTQTGGRLVLKPTRKQIEGGFLGTLLSCFNWNTNGNQSCIKNVWRWSSS